MKKVFTLVMMMLVAGTTGMFADVDQTFQFCDKDGNIIADGTDWVSTDAHLDPDWGDCTVYSGLYAKNTSSKDASIKVRVNLIQNDNGFPQICYPNGCIAINAGETFTNIGSLASGAIADLQLKWGVESYGECKMDVTLLYMVKKTFGNGYNEIEGPTVHVTFRYSDTPSGIESSLTHHLSTRTTIYDLQGRELQGVPQHGIYIMNGKKYVK